MVSRNFKDERPKKRHLVFKEKGGVAGEVGDLRSDIDEGLSNVEGELDNLITVLDHNTVLISGKIKLNFQGVGVSLSIDGVDPRKVNITINTSLGDAADISLPGFDTSNVTTGRAVYVSSNNTVLHTDAKYYPNSIALGLYAGISGRIITQGVVSGAKFSSSSPIPVPGNRVFLARADDEALDAAEGKLTVAVPSPASSFVAEVGVVTYVNAITYLTTRTASVAVGVKKMMRRGM
jgi:hypothetical protein